MAVSCGIGRRLGSDLMLLWLWCRPAAVALIGPLAWEPLYAMGAALKRQNKKNKQKNKWEGKAEGTSGDQRPVPVCLEENGF